MKASDAAKYVIAKSDNVGDLITNKKLQKILYYIKAWGIVYFDDGVIDDDFEAWIHGPVCSSVYQEYKHFGYKPLSIHYNGASSSGYISKFKAKFEKTQKGKEKIEMIDVVFEKYAKLTSLQLELLTHSEAPWLESRNGLSPIDNSCNIIGEDAMRKFYSDGNK
jgi:uncharacterized phage-associated protein